MPVNSCGSTTGGVLIYLLFQTLMAYIVLSIMIGVILENFANGEPPRPSPRPSP